MEYNVASSFVLITSTRSSAGNMKTRYGSVADVLNSMDIPEAQKKRQVAYIKARQLPSPETMVASPLSA